MLTKRPEGREGKLLPETKGVGENEILDTFGQIMEDLGWEVSRGVAADEHGLPYDMTLASESGRWVVDYLSYEAAGVPKEEMLEGWASHHEKSGKNLILLDPDAAIILDELDGTFPTFVLQERRKWVIQTSVKGLDEFIRAGLAVAKNLPTPVFDLLYLRGMAATVEVGKAIKFAVLLLQEKEADQDLLSTSTLFFALVEFGFQLAESGMATFFLSRFIRENSHSEYMEIRDSFFSGTPLVLDDSDLDLASEYAFGLSHNVNLILADAAEKSFERSGAPIIRARELIESLLAANHTGLAGRLAQMSSLPPVEKILENLRGGSDPAASDSTDSPAVVSTHATSDLWTVDDKLGYSEYARAIFHFLRDPRTEPPLTISIQAPWGGGKTSLMRMVQKQLDPDGYDQQTGNNRETLQDALRATTRNILDELRQLGRKEATSIELDLRGGSCATVWFNAWRYESSDQIWAGLAESVIRGITDRLSPVDREKFLLRLHLNRVNPDQVRARFYDSVFSRLFGMFRSYGVTALLVLGSIAALLWNAAIPIGDTGGEISLGISTIAAGGLAALGALWKANNDASNEPAKFSLSEYVQVPNYSEKLGFVHHVTEDLRRVFELLPAKDADNPGERVPLAIFIDDLDRCSPAKVADVFEAINLFVAGEFPNCYILIGMDTEVVAAALEEAHKDVINNLPSHAHRVPVGWRFMDKFVQLPFVIPPIDVGAIGNYAEHLAAAEDAEAREVQRRATGEEARAVEAQMRESLDKGEKESRILEEAARVFAEDVTDDDTKALQESRRLAERQLDSLKRQRFIDQRAEEFRSDSSKIETLLLRAKKHFSSNPRELKRLVNVYRFYYNLRLAREARELEVPTDEQLQNWLIFSLAWPQVVRWIRQGFADWNEEPDSDGGGDIVASRLSRLEELAFLMAQDNQSSGTFLRAKWAKAVREEFDLQEDTAWLADRRLFPFFRHLGSADAESRISAGAGRGFW